TYPEPSVRRKIRVSGRIHADTVSARVVLTLRASMLGASTKSSIPLNRRDRAGAAWAGASARNGAPSDRRRTARRDMRVSLPVNRKRDEHRAASAIMDNLIA